MARGEVILEYFNTSWKEIATRMPELAEAGYSALWLPYPVKASSIWDVGYGPTNRFDLGSQVDSITNNLGTMYGTAADVINLVQVAHRFGIRVYFDNVMAQNGGPMPGANQYTSIYVQPGMVPEDFHLMTKPDGTYGPWPTGVDYSNVWQIWFRNPFGIDIAEEVGTGYNGAGLGYNMDFGPTEMSWFPKYVGIRQPNNPELYPDLAAPILETDPVTGGTFNEFTFDGHGTPVPEDVNQYLYRAVRWLIDQTKCDGFRLDEVKSVPDGFFGDETSANKDSDQGGYCGQIQTQFNITHGFNSWDELRASQFDENQPRVNALMFGEHLGEPPSRAAYLNAGMRVSEDGFMNTVAGNVNYDTGALSDGLGSQDGNYLYLDQPGYGTWSGNPGQAVAYAMSHDTNNVYTGHYKLAHLILLTQQTPPIVYTDGFNHSGPPDYFPRWSSVPFLGQAEAAEGQSTGGAGQAILNELYLHNQFARGIQISKWHDSNFAAWERQDKSENTSMSDADGTVLLVMIARLGQGSQSRSITTTFPSGAPLYNYSLDGGGFYAYVQSNGTLLDGNGNPIIVPDGGYFAFSWRSPETSTLWQAGPALTILQSGTAPGTMTYIRKDGADGDPNFNPYGVAGAVPGSYSYPWTVPLITGTNLSFIARMDASAETVRFKLDGGIDLNSQMGAPFVLTTNGTANFEQRDERPGLVADWWLGYEQSQFVSREYGEKFAAVDTTRCLFGSMGAETYLALTGTYNTAPANSNTYDNETGRVASWVYHNPNDVTDQGVKQYIDNGNGTVTVWVKTNSVGAGFRAFIYFTTDGATYPEGADGVGIGSTGVAELHWNHNDSSGNNWWGNATVPKAGPDFRYKISLFKDTVSGTGSSPVASIFPDNAADVYDKKQGMTTYQITGWNPSTINFYPNNDYGVVQTGLSQGFHILRMRAYLNRSNPTRASIWNTVTQTFYYDTQLPGGFIQYPANDGDSVGGQQYGVKLWTDTSVTDVQYEILDSDPDNDDSVTGVANGNGAWVEASPVEVDPVVSGSFPNEWNFNYVNIPQSGQATIKVRLRKLTSSSDNTLSDAAGHFTTLTRTVATNGPNIKLFVAYPQTDDQVVGTTYTVKIQFNDSLISGQNAQQALGDFQIAIASTQSSSPVNPVIQPSTDYSIDGYNVNNSSDPTQQLAEIALTLPNLYNGNPNFLHSIIVNYSRTGYPPLTTTRLVKFYPQPVITDNIVSPPELDAQNQPYQIILPDVPSPTAAQRTVPIQVLTDTNATSCTISFNQGSVSSTNIVLTSSTLSGSYLSWNFNWINVQQGGYTFTSTVTTGSGTATANRDATVLIRALVTGPVKGDTDDDGLPDTIETTGTTYPSNPTSDQVHLAMIAGKTNPNLPDTDGDGLSDGLELGWATAVGDTNPNTSTNGKFPNFQPDLDPPIYNTGDMSSPPSGQDYSYYNPWPHNSNNPVTDQIAGSMTNPNSPDTDNDGLSDGVEDLTYGVVTGSNGSPILDANGHIKYFPVHNGRVDIIPDVTGTQTAIAHPPTIYNTSMVNRAAVLAKSPNAMWLETDPNNADTTGCGMIDGAKDANHNGIVDLAIIDRNQTDVNGNFVVKAIMSNPLQPVTAQGSAAGSTPQTFYYLDFCYPYIEPQSGNTSFVNSMNTSNALAGGGAGSANTTLFYSTALDKNRLNAFFRPSGTFRSDGLDVIWLETDPRRFSTTGDGLPDGWKTQYGLDPFDDGVIGHYNLHTGKPITNTNNGPNGDIDGSGFTNLEDYIGGINPITPPVVVAPAPNTITIGPGLSSTVGAVVNNHEFTDWTAKDLIALDYYDGDGVNAPQNNDVYHFYDGFDSSRDLVAFYAHDGGDPKQGGDGNFYFRVDMHDLQAYAEQTALNIFVAINFGHPGTGEYNLPEDVATGTTMGWQACVVCYQGNMGVVYLWNPNSATHSTAIGQDLSQFGVTGRNQNAANGFEQAYFNSNLDAVEFSISRQALLDAGWNGLDASDLTYQVFTVHDFTGPGGAGDIGNAFYSDPELRSDITDSIRNDWIASDYWNDQVNIDGAKSVLTQWVGLKADNDNGKRIKVMSLIHQNESLQPGSYIQNLINTGSGAGFYRPLDAHEAFGVPLAMHITPTLASAIQWAKVNPSSPNQWHDGPSLNARIARLASSGMVDLIGSTFSDHILAYASEPFNQDNVNLATQFLTSIYGQAPSSNVFWNPERVSNDAVLNKINGLGYGYTFVDQFQHIRNWFGWNSAVSSDGYRINQINNTRCFVINDDLGGYMLYNDDNGLPISLREVLEHLVRVGPNDQIVILENDWENFTNKASADAYDKNIAWLACHPWIQMVTPDMILSGTIDTSVPPTGTGGFGTVNRGTGLTLPTAAKDWIDYATEGNYDNWYFGSSLEESLYAKEFNIRSGVALSGSYGEIGSGVGLSDAAWNAVAALGGAYGTISQLARGTIHASMFETAFHNEGNADLTEYSTGVYADPDTTYQTLSTYSTYAQSQTRKAAIYAKVNAWAALAATGTYNSTAVAEATDIDLDGEPEYLLYNDRVFGMFERIGGRMTNGWVRDVITGEVFQVVGNPLSNAGSETEEEGTLNLDNPAILTGGTGAYRTSGFKDLFAQTGGPGVGTLNYVNNYYSVQASGTGTGTPGWTFTSSDGAITKTITLAPYSSVFVAGYTVSPSIQQLFVRTGLSPNLYDLLLNGQTNLTVPASGTTGAFNVVDQTPARSVRGFVQYSGTGYSALLNSTALDQSQASFDTINMRNQAQTQQVEVTGSGTFVFGLGFQTNWTDTLASDPDGIPDWWRLKYFGHTTGLASDLSRAGDDPAQDGLTNMQKYILMLNPLMKAVNAGPTVKITYNGQKLPVISFNTLPDRYYRVYYSTTPGVAGTWTQVGPVVYGNGSVQQWVDDGSQTNGAPSTVPHRFYKVQVSLN